MLERMREETNSSSQKLFAARSSFVNSSSYDPSSCLSPPKRNLVRLVSNSSSSAPFQSSQLEGYAPSDLQMGRQGVVARRRDDRLGALSLLLLSRQEDPGHRQRQGQ